MNGFFGQSRRNARMNNRRKNSLNKQLHFLISILLGIGVTGAFAQRSSTKNHVAELRQSLHGLKWENVDYDALSTLERCRALTLLDHALSEVGAVATAEADLMSEYVEQQGFGEEFASSQTAEAAPTRSYNDAQKTAVALLQGPMAESRFATMYEGSDETSLRASLQLHESGSRRKWRKFSESGDRRWPTGCRSTPPGRTSCPM